MLMKFLFDYDHTGGLFSSWSTALQTLHLIKKDELMT